MVNVVGVKPTPKFDIATSQIVAVPTTVHDSGKAKVVGMEWAPDNWHIRYNGWVYYLSFGSGTPFVVKEEELLRWQSA